MTKENTLRSRLQDLSRYVSQNWLIIGGFLLGAGLVFVCFVSFNAQTRDLQMQSTGSGSPDYNAYNTVRLSDSVSDGSGSVNVYARLIDEEPATTAETLDATLAPNAGATTANRLQTMDRLIIRNGNISLVVADTRATRSKIENMVDEMADEGAFVVSGNEWGGVDGASPRIEMVIRIPSSRFDRVMNRLAELAIEVPNRNESAQDVTEEYVDLDNRLTSLEAARQRLLEIMQDARTTEELLQAEQQLTYRETEIESLKGRMQYLSQAAKLSSIHITLQPDRLNQPLNGRWQPARTARQAFRDLGRDAQSFGDMVIYFVIAGLPWLLLFGGFVYGVVRFISWRRRVSRQKREAATPEAS